MSTKIRIAKNAPSNLVEYDENIDDVVLTKWNLQSKLEPNRVYSGNFVERYENGWDFNLKTLELNGFSKPILFVNKDGLGLKLPHDDFSVDDVSINVGKSRILDVVDVETQNAIGMTMKDWCEYYKNPNKTQLLNVISLEYSQSKLDAIVRAPDVVLQLDWLESCWPEKCRDIHVDNKSYLKTLTYPKVRKYCLMSVAGCYTDFHIDLGGTSVWYHIFKGEKIFWIAPPTPDNLSLYEKWCLSSEQSSLFFPDLIAECEKVHLKPGNTFMIPSGWIHGVYTPVDSLVFGGNFLHSFSIPLQLAIWDVEEKIKVGTKYRYPFFIEMHWYVLAAFVGRINGISYLTSSLNQNKSISKVNSINTLNQYESNGIRSICKWLKEISLDTFKSVPNDIADPAALLSDAEHACKSIIVDSNSFNHAESFITSAKSEQKTGQINNNIDLGLLSSNSKYMKLEIVPLTKSKSKSRKSNKQQRHGKPKIEITAEIPHSLYNQITQRTGSRQIVRPNRLVENPFN